MSAGSSGGGLFDSDGLLIGITTFGLKEGQNLNFANPADWIEDIPERAKILLENHKKAQALATAAESPVDKILTSAELKALLRYERRFNIIEPTGLEKLVFYGNGDVMAEFRMTNRVGQHSVKTRTNQLCLNFWIHSGARMLPYLNDCFTVSLTSAKKYKFTSTDKKFTVIGEL